MYPLQTSRLTEADKKLGNFEEKEDRKIKKKAQLTNVGKGVLTGCVEQFFGWAVIKRWIFQ